MAFPKDWDVTARVDQMNQHTPCATNEGELGGQVIRTITCVASCVIKIIVHHCNSSKWVLFDVKSRLRGPKFMVYINKSYT